MISICGTEFDLEHPTSIYLNCDCMDGMKQFPDKYFDLAVVDPPYGIDVSTFGCGSRQRKYDRSNAYKWDSNPPNVDYWEQVFRVSKNQVIFGMNYYKLPPTKEFIVWDKKQPDGVTFAQAEIAWTSFSGTSKIFRMTSMGQKDRIHQAQKPVALYEWILSRYAKEGDIILDTHVGSASSLIACRNTNHKFVGFELDEYYYKLSKERLDRELAQMNLYDFMGG